MATLVERVTLLAQRLGADVKALRNGKADDTAVVHKVGDETVSGVKTFGSAPVVPTGSAAGNPVRRDDGRLSDARTPLGHSHSSADVSDFARAASYHASPTGARGDRVAYGDELSPFPRLFAAGSGGALATLFYSAVVAGYDDTATKVRLGVNGAAAGTGSLTVGVFVGADPANLTRVATASATAVASGVLELTLSGQVSWTAGQWVVVAVVLTGFTTVPTLRWLGGGGPGSAMLNGALLLAVARASVSAMPTTLNLSTGGGSSGTPLWWALTG